MKLILLMHFSCFVLISCNKKISQSDISYVKNEQWLYQNGFKLGDGDWVDFDDSSYYSIRKDTIFKARKPIALIRKVDQKRFLLILASISTGEKGIYGSASELSK
jgi:hypothetical protein